MVKPVGTTIATVKAGEWVTQEGAEEVLESLAKELFTDGGDEEGVHTEVQRK